MNRIQTLSRWLIATTCALTLVPVTATSARAQAPAATPQQASPKIPNDQLDSLVAPIALYPDPLLAQVLAASTYPLELVQLQQWLGQHTGLKDQALVDAVGKEGWDPSVQSMAALPDVLKMLANDIKWTTDLGNAFLAQESDVMSAVQRMRTKAKEKGALKSTSEMKVVTQVVDSQTVVVIQQANPSVIYVPSYNPTIVYGPPPYPYPPVAYPAYHAAAGMAVAFGVGVAMGAAFHGGWGYHAGWGGHGNVTVNRNNIFVRNSSTHVGGGNSWQHNPQHRGGAPYGNAATAQRFGGQTRGAAARRPAGAGQQRGAGAGQQHPAGAGQQRPAGAGQQRPAGAGQQRPAGAGQQRGAGGDRVGNRSVPSGGGRGGAFGGGSGSYSGNQARANSSRGAASTGGRSGGRSGGGGRRR